MFASFTNFAYIYILPVHVLEIGGSNTDVGLMGTGLTLVGLVTRLMLAQDLGTGAGAAGFGVTSEYLGYPVTFIASSIIT